MHAVKGEKEREMEKMGNRECDGMGSAVVQLLCVCVCVCCVLCTTLCEFIVCITLDINCSLESLCDTEEL